MEENSKTVTFETLSSAMLLHEALIAVLYSDHIEHDKERRGMKQNEQESLELFRNQVNDYIELYPSRLIDEIRRDAKSHVAGFFKDVEVVLKFRADRERLRD